MTRYRLYYLADGQLPDLDEIEARDDAEAAVIARDRAGHRLVEIWCSGRRVRTIAPIPDG